MRDADVLLQRFGSRAVSGPGRDAVLSALAAQRRVAFAELVAALRGERYVALLDRLVAAAREPALTAAAVERGKEVLPEQARSRWRSLVKTVRKLGDDASTEDLHDVRIRVKRCRYAVEAVEPALGKGAGAFARELARLQDRLGDLNDAAVAESWLRDWAHGRRGAAVFAAGELAGLERADASASRRRWRKGLEVGGCSRAAGPSVTTVEAAGGVVVHDGQVALVHRPAYDDWTLPKGKLEPGEELLQAAVREVAEETGLRCLLGQSLGTVEYVDGQGRDKTVHYWPMAATADELTPTKEVDDARWVPLAEASEQLTYERDRDVLARAAALIPGGPVTAFLVRHAKAGNRDKWDPPDELRPLTRAGRAQAEALVGLLAERSPVVLVSSPYVRCVETLAPFADRCALPIQRADELAEGASAAEALELLAAAVTFGPAVACTHGDVQQAVVESLAESVASLSSPLRFAKGSTWELELDHDHGRLVHGRYVAPPA